MGNFSRDPDARLSDARGKHHVAVRLQQGVPLLDADWNALDDLRRVETEEAGRWSIGDGVPFGNDGFRIVPIAGGGVDTLVLTSTIADSLVSSLRVDIATSTAAVALGFNDRNSFAARMGSSPARLTGNAAAPFSLVDGSKLVVTVNETNPETVTFHSAGFVNIAAATAAEVVAAIVAALTRASASAGTGNDFMIRGGDGTTENAGRIMVRGRAALNESDLKYSEQALFQNGALATQWGVSLVPALASSLDPHVAFLDLWDREVDSAEDEALIDTRIGVETAVRLRREWAVRMVRESDYPATAAVAPAGHAYYPLARVTRAGNGSPVTAAAIQDLRDTDLSVRRGVIFRSADGLVLVDTVAFRKLLTDTRDAFRDFITFLATKFVTPDAAYTAGEVAGMQALATIAQIAEHGIALIGGRTLDTAGALELMDELRGAEVRLVAIWTAGVLPIVKAAGPIYNTAFANTIALANTLLVGPTPVGFVSLTQAVQTSNLLEALRTQQQINQLFVQETGRPTGFLLLTYLGSTTATITRNQPFDLRFRATGNQFTMQDSLLPGLTIGPGWGTTFKNADASVPFSMTFGPGSGNQEFLITVQTPDLAAAETDIAVQISATHNPLLSHFASSKHLKMGAPPPPSEQDFAFRITAFPAPPVGSDFHVVASEMASFDFKIGNNTNSPVDVEVTGLPATSPAWGIFPLPLPAQLTVPAHGEFPQTIHYDFVAPTTVGSSLAFTLQAKRAGTSTLLASISINLVTVAPH